MLTARDTTSYLGGDQAGIYLLMRAGGPNTRTARLTSTSLSRGPSDPAGRPASRDPARKRGPRRRRGRARRPRTRPPTAAAPRVGRELGHRGLRGVVVENEHLFLSSLTASTELHDLARCVSPVPL